MGINQPLPGTLIEPGQICLAWLTPGQGRVDPGIGLAIGHALNAAPALTGRSVSIMDFALEGCLGRGRGGLMPGHMHCIRRIHGHRRVHGPVLPLGQERYALPTAPVPAAVVSLALGFK